MIRSLKNKNDLAVLKKNKKDNKSVVRKKDEIETHGKTGSSSWMPQESKHRQENIITIFQKGEEGSCIFFLLLLK